MKKLIVLPGNSPRNKTWGKRVAEEFGDLFDATYMHEYAHWDHEGGSMDFENEAEKLRNVTKRDDGGTQYCVFAKSFGSILMYISAKKGIVCPSKCVLFGVPLNVVREQKILSKDWNEIRDFISPTLVFLNRNDPVAEYNFIVEKFAELECNTVEIITMEIDNHSYTEFDDYQSIIEAFLKENPEF